MMRRLGSGLVAALVAATLAAGCGGDGGGDGSSATDWADGLCTAITDWTESVQATSNSLKSGNLTASSLREAAEDFRGATETFVEDVRALGAPDTEAGDRAEEAIRELADSVDENREKIDEAIEGNGGNLGETVSAVTQALAAMGQELAATFTTFEEVDVGGELEEAFRDAEACDELETEGG